MKTKLSSMLLMSVCAVGCLNQAKMNGSQFSNDEGRDPVIKGEELSGAAEFNCKEAANGVNGLAGGIDVRFNSDGSASVMRTLRPL